MENKGMRKLDRRSKIPLSIQLANTFRREILDGFFEFGEALPTVEELSHALELSIDEVQETFELLVTEKLIFFDTPYYRCKFKSVPTIIFEKISDFRYIIESRGMHYTLIDKPIEIQTDNEGTWIVLNRSYFGDQQCLILAVSHFRSDAFPTLLNKSVDDTRNFASIFNDNQLTRFDSRKTIDHMTLPDTYASEMNLPKKITCSKTHYVVTKNDEVILRSDSYIVGFGFRFNFTTKLHK